MFYMQAGRQGGPFVIQNFITYQGLIAAIHSPVIQDLMESSLKAEMEEYGYEIKE